MMSPENIIDFIRSVFNQKTGFIPLHAPRFNGKEREYVLETIDSTFVSSVGSFVNKFEEQFAKAVGAKYCIAITNGTTALHLALVVAGIKAGEEVLTQPLTFIATANAISHAGASPVFIDVDRDTMGLSPVALKAFLESQTEMDKNGDCINKKTGKRIAACVPMHTFGFPARIDEVIDICKIYNINVIEDAAESLGSYYKGIHTGNFGLMGVFSFNGNKIVTCGGGGAIVTNDENIAVLTKHLSTTAKIPHKWEFVHDMVAYNYRMPNLNAALACAQLEQLDDFLANKRNLADQYRSFFKESDVHFADNIKDASANFWLNTIILPTAKEKHDFLRMSNEMQVMTRPAWRLMHKLPMYSSCQVPEALANAEWLEDRIVNIPSSVRSN